jgi:predicted DNA-binding WGR domain protein
MKIKKFWMLMEEASWLMWDRNGIYGHYYYQSFEDAKNGAESMARSLTNQGKNSNTYIMECVGKCSARKIDNPVDWEWLNGAK